MGKPFIESWIGKKLNEKMEYKVPAFYDFDTKAYRSNIEDSTRLYQLKNQLMSLPWSQEPLFGVTDKLSWLIWKVEGKVYRNYTDVWESYLNVPPHLKTLVNVASLPIM